jgi:hypothetical protein
MGEDVHVQGSGYREMSENITSLKIVFLKKYIYTYM